jgi:hypothetical protein
LVNIGKRTGKEVVQLFPVRRGHVTSLGSQPYDRLVVTVDDT